MDGLLDLEGLLGAVGRHGLGIVDKKVGGLGLVEHLSPLVPEVMKAMGIPSKIDIGIAGMALGKVAVMGMQRQKEIDRINQQAREKRE